jgi:hypothetical protein
MLVAEELLDVPNVRACFEHQRRGSVPKEMAAGAALDAGGSKRVAGDLRDRGVF